MIVYAAIGCRDPEPPKYGWVVRESDGVWMGCNFSNHHWRLTCDGVRWIGQYENCSSGKFYMDRFLCVAVKWLSAFYLPKSRIKIELVSFIILFFLFSPP